MSNLFIYVLNSYREQASTHFSHIPNLLVNISRLNVPVVLLIEKCDGSPPVIEGVEVIVLNNSGSKYSIMRLFHLFRIIFSYRQVFPLVFVRITSISSLVVSAALLGSKGESVLWQSGATHEWDMSQPFSKRKVLWFVKSYLPGLLARKSCSIFTTGPLAMVDYYEQVHAVSRDKIRCLYNDVNTDVFRAYDLTLARDIFKSRYGIEIKHDDVCVLVVHSLSPVRSTYKYIPQCIDHLMSERPNLKVLMVGDGSERNKLELAVSKKDWSANFFFFG
jgi:glycosyltransferase involved in cell wall biosynthesis